MTQMSKGPVQVVKLDVRMEVWGQGKGRRTIQPWQLQWRDGSPLGVGLFATEEEALGYTRSPGRKPVRSR
jgi:hypothetical protein